MPRFFYCQANFAAKIKIDFTIENAYNGEVISKKGGDAQAMLKQVSVFAENSKGTMQRITAILLQEEINIWGSVTNDSAEYGIIRMVVSDPERALNALAAAGYLVKLTDVMGVEVEDKVGSMNTLLLAFSESNINVNYIYLSFNRDSGKPVLVCQTEDIWEAEECMAAKGFALL